jgi:hypothetical protein
MLAAEHDCGYGPKPLEWLHYTKSARLGRLQPPCVLFRRLKFADYGLRELHQRHICKFSYLSLKPQFLSVAEARSLLEVI